MPYTHKTYSVQSSLFAEKRLCRFDSPDRMEESLGAKEQIEKNQDMVDIIKDYQTAFNLMLEKQTDPKTKSRLLNESDREHFMSFVINGAIPGKGNIDYTSVNRTGMLGVDPLDHLGKDDEEMGRWLLQLFGDPNMEISLGERIKAILDSKKDLLIDARNDPKDVQKVKALGGVFKQKVASMQKKWSSVPNSPIESNMTELLVLHYLNKKTALEAMLKAKRIESPADKLSETDIARGNLSRSEYRGLLLMLWQGRDAEVDAMVRQGITGIRMGLADKANKPQTNRVDRIANDLSVGAESPGETLNRFGVVIGPIVLRDYMLMRTGAFNGKTNTPSDSAATWIDHPDRAYAFLINRLVATPANAEFLRALRFHLVLTDDERRSEVPSARPKMSADDTKKTLSLLVQQLVRREDVMDRSLQEREVMRKTEGLDEKVENQASKAWEYIKDFSSHPVGSFAIAAVAFLAIRSMWKAVSGGKASGFTKVMGGLGLFALGAVGINGYVKHQTGTSVFDRGMQYFGSGKNKNAREKDTITTYWNDRFTKNKGDVLEGAETGKCLALLQDRRVDEILPWYEKMDLAMRDPSKQRPDLPFAIKNKSKFFGSAKNSEISVLFYNTLKKFFDNRGKALARDPLFGGKGAVSGDAERGLAYIRMRYMNTREFNVLVEDRLKINKIEVNGKKFDLEKINITENDFTNPTHPDLLELKKLLKPENYAKILLGALIYRQAFAEDKTHQWTMSQVFLAEADPELLGTVDSDGANALSGLYHAIQDDVRKADKDSKNTPQEPEVNKLQLTQISGPLEQTISAPLPLEVSNKPLSFTNEKPLILESNELLQVNVNGKMFEVTPGKPLTIPENSTVILPVKKSITLSSFDRKTPVKVKFKEII